MLALRTASGQTVGAMRSKSWPLAPGPAGGGVRIFGSTPQNLKLLGGKVANFADLYWTQPWCYAVINKLVRGVARLDWKVYELDAQRTAIENPTCVPAKILRNPFERAGAFQLKEFLMGSLCVYGNATFVKFRGGQGQTPAELWPMPFERVTIIQGTTRPIEAYQYWGLNTLGTYAKPITFLPEDVVHFTWFNPENARPWWGRSPLEALATTIALEDAGQRYALSHYGNNARPASFIVSEKKMTKEQRENLRAEIDSAYGGPDNAFKVALLDAGLDWKPIAQSARDSQLIENRKISREEVCAVFDIPPPLVGILDHATYCLPGHSNVFTAEGPRPISEIRVGERVWSQVDDRIELRRVLSSRQTGVDSTLKIKTTNRTLEASATHPIQVRRLRKVMGKTRWHWEPEHVFVPAGDLKLGDILVTLNELPALDGGARAHEESVEMMEFYGLYVGDGSMMKDRKRRPTGVSLARHRQALYFGHYRETMATFTGRDGAVTLIEDERATRVTSASVAQSLIERGFEGTAHTKQVPGWVFEMSRELRLAFLRGYLDADGSVDKMGRISFASCNETLLQQVRHLCISVGVPVTNVLHSRRDVKLPDGRLFDSTMFCFTCSDPGANRTIGSHDPRYQERLAAGKPFGRKDRNYPYRPGKHSTPPAGCSYAKIRSIEISEIAQPVYDIEVEGSHNFIAEGVVVHNSNIDTQVAMLYQDTIAPILAMLDDTLNAQFLNEPAWSNFFARFDMSEVVRGNVETRSQAQQRWFMSGMKTPNELRKMEGDGPIGDPQDKANPMNWCYVPVNTAPATAEGLLEPIRGSVVVEPRDIETPGATGATGPIAGATGITGPAGITGATAPTGA